MGGHGTNGDNKSYVHLTVVLAFENGVLEKFAGATARQNRGLSALALANDGQLLLDPADVFPRVAAQLFQTLHEIENI
jgi:hypothetical protein